MARDKRAGGVRGNEGDDVPRRPLDEEARVPQDAHGAGDEAPLAGVPLPEAPALVGREEGEAVCGAAEAVVVRGVVQEVFGALLDLDLGEGVEQPALLRVGRGGVVAAVRCVCMCVCVGGGWTRSLSSNSKRPSTHIHATTHATHPSSHGEET